MFGCETGRIKFVVLCIAMGQAQAVGEGGHVSIPTDLANIARSIATFTRVEYSVGTSGSPRLESAVRIRICSLQMDFSPSNARGIKLKKQFFWTPFYHRTI